MAEELHWFIKIVRKMVIYAVLSSVIMTGVMWKYQDSFLYMPSMPVQDQRDNEVGYRLPSERPILKHYSEVTIQSEDLTLRGWFIRAEHGLSKKTIVFMHENAGNIGLRMDFFEHMVGSLEVNILTVAYRGYSQSQGTPTEIGLKRDGLAIMQWAQSNRAKIVAPDGDLYLLGRSLGGAVATFVASHPATPYDLFSGLIIENTFTSISDMVDIMFYPPISTFKEQILEIDWNTFELVPSVTLPVLFVSGDEDELVPDYMTSKLYQATTSAAFKDILIVEGGMHNDTWEIGGDKYLAKVKKFMEQAANEPKKPKIAKILTPQTKSKTAKSADL